MKRTILSWKTCIIILRVLITISVCGKEIGSNESLEIRKAQNAFFPTCPTDDTAMIEAPIFKETNFQGSLLAFCSVRDIEQLQCEIIGNEYSNVTNTMESNGTYKKSLHHNDAEGLCASDPTRTTKMVSNNIRVERGRQLCIQCTAENNKTMETRWYKGRIPLAITLMLVESESRGRLESDKVPYNITEKGHLVINNVSYQHNGSYTCIDFYNNGTFRGKIVTVITTKTIKRYAKSKAFKTRGVHGNTSLTYLNQKFKTLEMQSSTETSSRENECGANGYPDSNNGPMEVQKLRTGDNVYTNGALEDSDATGSTNKFVMYLLVLPYMITWFFGLARLLKISLTCMITWFFGLAGRLKIKEISYTKEKVLNSPATSTASSPGNQRVHLRSKQKKSPDQVDNLRWAKSKDGTNLKPS